MRDVLLIPTSVEYFYVGTHVLLPSLQEVLAIWTDIRIVSVLVALEAEHHHVLLVIVLILGKNFVSLLARKPVLLAVGALMARLPAIVTPNTLPYFAPVPGPILIG